MYEDISQLAESKLILLYIMHNINLPISKNQLTQIVLENNLVNYFSLQQYLADLIDSDFLVYTNKNNQKLLSITDRGSKVLEMFQSRIPDDIILKVDNYLETAKDNIKREISLYSDYTIEKSNTFIVNLKAMENDIILIDVKVNVPTKKHAIDLCANWKSNSSQIYNDIMKLLINH
ncbi:DUF4364 family protein [Clostridium sp. 19966]|uniref:DUF4364 family protein n=1 Tax=Clostridium sp. 19966 TaxID=2768166 RepID=UPI0028DD4460|nr:DUF4364 family protein [Clostridium sp. 19966]MDT8716545.1 DUF4364 family protein [Clostridium sp. 19966]